MGGGDTFTVFTCDLPCNKHTTRAVVHLSHMMSLVCVLENGNRWRNEVFLTNLCIPDLYRSCRFHSVPVHLSDMTGLSNVPQNGKRWRTEFSYWLIYLYRSCKFHNITPASVYLGDLVRLLRPLDWQ